jgi:hypothetical protein
MKILTAVATIAIFISISGAALACPSCRDAVAAKSSNGPDLATGFAVSIGLLLAVPLALVSTGAVAVWRASRREPVAGQGESHQAH